MEAFLLILATHPKKEPYHYGNTLRAFTKTKENQENKKKQLNITNH